MILIWAIVIGIMIGFLRRGNVGNLARLDLHGLWLILIALIAQLLIFPLGEHPPIISTGAGWVHILSYLLLLAFVLINLRHWQLFIMGVGLILNLVVIAFNGGLMPASENALRAAGMDAVADTLVRDSFYTNVTLMRESTNLNFLGDRLHLPKCIPLASAFSIGDLILAIGIILLLGMKMTSHKKPNGKSED